MRRSVRWLLWIVLALLALIASGLLLGDRLTPQAVGAPSHALPPQGAATAIDRALAAGLAKHPGRTGVLMVPDGIEAFAVRAAAARAAGRSLDLQYYIWHDDLAGHLLGRELFDAAERGVRVRLLLDDINATGLDPQLLVLDAHPDIEIRLYNPFRNRGGLWRLVELVQRVFSVNHRMHNKAWIADGRVAVVGGRNIGDEYFDAGRDVNFRDLDLVLLGPGAGQASGIFDAFWNSRAVVPVSALNRGEEGELRALAARLRTETRNATAQRYLHRVEPALRRLLAGQASPHWIADLRVRSDPPQKAGDADRSDWLVAQLLETLHTTKREALLISPYFVPGDTATQDLVTSAASGADVGIVTNSLATNDVVAVHSGYAKYRKRLLAGGVRVHEIRREPGQAVPRSAFGSSGASLHTKAFVLDGRRGFVGSFNLDPRSAELNTEMGVLFDDAALAAELRREYQRLASPALSYEAFLDEEGAVRWRDAARQPPAILDREPDATFGQRATARVLGWLPIESQL